MDNKKTGRTKWKTGVKMKVMIRSCFLDFYSRRPKTKI